jgi:hypothetical protein
LNVVEGKGFLMEGLIAEGKKKLKDKIKRVRK